MVFELTEDEDFSFTTMFKKEIDIPVLLEMRSGIDCQHKMQEIIKYEIKLTNKWFGFK
jgi:hypothetical protein